MICLLIIFGLMESTVAIYRTNQPPQNICTVTDECPESVVYDSFLLTEGESLLLNCGLLNDTKVAQEFDRALDEWFIQRARYVGYGGDVGGRVEEAPFNLTVIRRRLRRRLWPNAQDLPTSILELEQSVSDDKNATDKPVKPTANVRQLQSNLKFYFVVSKAGQPTSVIKYEGARYYKLRIQQEKDKLLFKQTRSEDTGVYYCVWNGRTMAEWAVTVLKPEEEPYHYVGIADINSTEEMSKTVDKEVSYRSKSALFNPSGLFLPQALVGYNLRLYTHWEPKTPCAPCTPKEQMLRSAEAGADGAEYFIGTCYISILDPFYPVKPHELSLRVDRILRQYKPKGLPCRSHLIVEAMDLYGPDEINHRPSEIVIRECRRECPNMTDDEPAAFSYPQRIRLRLNEGASTVISCPVQGLAKYTVSWYYSYSDPKDLVNLTQTALSPEIIKIYGSPARYLMSELIPVRVADLFQQTRGRYRLDPAQNIIVTEILPPSEEDDQSMLHLICIYGNSDSGFPDWAGIIDIDVVPQSHFVALLSKISQVVLLLIPFLMACGVFLIIAVTMHTERQPYMRAAAEGFTKKPMPK
ncbi:unnamed protein product [Calicophoron daubneyi]|uniref:Ig-like domain-containing protein n=1 Tax=Calicophoron daubneyi TaxID=300641 RepID=A0AAV2TNP0_CALDB